MRPEVWHKVDVDPHRAGSPFGLMSAMGMLRRAVEMPAW